MSARASHRRRRRMTRLQKVSVATGVAAVGATGLAAAVVPGQQSGTVRTTTGADLAARPVAWQAAADSTAAQKAGIDAQSSHADDRAQAAAREAAQRKAEAEKRAEAARRAAQEKREAAAAKAERERAAREKAARERAAAERAQQERARQQAASRSAQREEPGASAGSSPSGSPQQVARQIIGDEAQFQCFSRIVERESGWNVHAQNASSGAYGLVQALPGSKMASAGPDWRNNAATQIKWGLGYMNDRYGSPCGAWSFWQANHWY